ncbi:hypothetical protein HPB48_004346 [Haemaphysalis longicornis]|uniref:Phospholipase A2 n=1 Tax=Haemaphysalis longicornis TaxID=44386 RepID=A0A9J6G1J3_HAELO|nr:hypothetical protein HPB48_004346 [Haemaphysalis longicornis]
MSERRALSRRRSPGASGSPLSGQRQGSSKGVPLLVKVPSPGEENGRHRAGARARRSIVQLANMLKCVSGCNPLSYRGYGCFCGYMGDGTPVDHIDSCCLEHDWCYSQSPCSKLSLYLLPYDWHCLTPGMAHCAHPSSLSPHAHCGQQLCQCDLEFANCVSRYPCPRRRVSCQHSKRKVKGRRQPPGHSSPHRRPGWRSKRPGYGSTPWTAIWFPTSSPVPFNNSVVAKAPPGDAKKTAKVSPENTEPGQGTNVTEVDPPQTSSFLTNLTDAQTSKQPEEPHKQESSSALGVDELALTRSSGPPDGPSRWA